MVDASREHIRDRLNAPVRMPRKSGPIIIGTIVAEIVEQQERIELVRIAEAEGATQLHPRAFHRGCGFNNALHRPNRHDEPPSAVSRFRLGSSQLWEGQAAGKGRELIDERFEKSARTLIGDVPVRIEHAGLERDVGFPAHDEDPKNPLTDQQIVEMFAQKGVKIARRTVAKYRDQLSILPARMRKRL